jgi:tRNA(fMet)-specific endonuclease VapC
METSREIDVTTLDAAHRQAFEDVIGAHLEPNQRLVISVTAPAPPRLSQSLADWTAVYDGLTEDQVEAIDQNLKTRANLTRILP